MRKCSYLAVAILLLHASFGWAQVNVLTQHNDVSRTGANLKETSLNTSNVKASLFGKLFKRSVDGQIYAQPLYVSNVSIPNQGSHNVVYIATMHNSVYAFDADNPDASTPLWQRNLGPSVPEQDVGVDSGDIKIEIGITSTPVIDVSNVSSQTLYCVAKTKENGAYFQRLHALDITTGQPKSGSPVVITASASGTGDASVNGKISFNPLRHLNRPALLLLNGVIYLAFGSHGDLDPYHAWVLSYNATTLQQMAVYNGTANGSRGGIWQGGQGLAADTDGFIYVMIGNGTFDGNTGGPDLGMSFIKLNTPGLAVADWFTPYNFDSLNSGDMDLGGSGPLVIPETNLVLGGGKEGFFHLLNRSSMGHFNAGSNNQIVQNFHATAGHIHGSPIYWNGPNGAMIYVWSEQDKLKQFRLANGELQTTPFATSTMKVPYGMPGAMLSLSANGSAAGSGIIWASHPYNADANPATVAGIFRAFDASDVSVELWNSKQNAARDDVGNFAKFCPPTVANGKVYLATFSNQLVVYGRLDVNVAPGSSGDDFNGNGKADILWRNGANGQTVVWLMNGTQYDSTAPWGTVAGLSWKLAGSGDFDGDGQTDLLWRNYSTGQSVLWLMNGTQYTRAMSLGTVADTNWKIVAAADFNGDGKPDILWRHVGTGQNVVWLMNGTQYTRAVSLWTVADTNWNIVGAADFNSDGKPDVVWSNPTTGQNVVWFMTGTTYLGDAVLATMADHNWKIEAMSDYDGDGHPDLLWRSAATGQIVLWLMDGATYKGSLPLGTVADPNWKIGNEQ